MHVDPRRARREVRALPRQIQHRRGSLERSRKRATGTRGKATRGRAIAKVCREPHVKRREVPLDGAEGRRFVHPLRSKIAEDLLNEARDFLASPHEPCTSWTVRMTSLQAGEKSAEALGVTESAP